MKRYERAVILTAAVVLAATMASAVPSQTETVNCIVAVVNKRMITLTDVKLVEAFGFFETKAIPDAREHRRFLLDKLIDQKVVIDIAREKAPVDQAKVEDELNQLLARLGRDEAKRRLEEFGLEAADLKPFLEEKVLGEMIIASRFGRSTGVTLREIEIYYAETYAPGQKKLGQEPKPLIEVLKTIEAEIKKNKVETQVAHWIKNLRQQAEIEVRPDCLNK